jgi:hypothetical protein
MVDGKCSKNFPKAYRKHTTLCHINIECVLSLGSIKYIYKYVYKGHNHTTM